MTEPASEMIPRLQERQNTPEPAETGRHRLIVNGRSRMREPGLLDSPLPLNTLTTAIILGSALATGEHPLDVQRVPVPTPEPPSQYVPAEPRQPRLPENLIDQPGPPMDSLAAAPITGADIAAEALYRERPTSS